MTLPAGVHFESYAQDRALIRPRPQWIRLALFAFPLPALPFPGPGRLPAPAHAVGLPLRAPLGAARAPDPTALFSTAGP